MKLKQLYLSIEGLSAYESLKHTPLMEEMRVLLAGLVQIGESDPYWAVVEGLNRYSKVFSLLRSGGYGGLGDYFWDYLRFSDSHYGKLVTQGRSDPALENGARREVETLISLAKLDCDKLLTFFRTIMEPEDQVVLGDLPRWSCHCPFDFATLTVFHQKEGYGKFAKDKYFSWRNDCLRPIEQVSARPFNAMRGYGQNRDMVLRNTMKLVSGEKALHVLLFGDGGTGKSAVVKSMALEFPTLRLIQADHNSLRSLPELICELGASPYPFVIFIDDLAFDNDDNTFSALKSILEGGLETPPKNVCVYATSNRRHLVRQTFRERAGEEVDMMETIAEKTALSERFGLRIPYMTMNKAEYLALVEYLYQEKGLSGHTQEELHGMAMEWEIRRGGRTPRVAEQFVCSL